MALSIGAASDPTAPRTPAREGAMGDSELMEPTTFERPEDFRDWLEQHHDGERERWVGYYKKRSGKASMRRIAPLTRPEP
jgi:hypothetical protein